MQKMCEVCRNEKILRRVIFINASKREFYLDLGAKCIIEMVGD